jgi:hypothetical protein
VLRHERQLATKELIFKKSIPEPNSGCWLWLDSAPENGYGTVSAFYPGLSSYWQAHRLSYFLFNGNLTPGLMVRHICHNKICVNPDHLKQGTAKDNSDDNKRKWT